MNIAYIVGNSFLRIWAVGWENRPPTGQELETMKSLLRESMEEVVFDLKTIRAHATRQNPRQFSPGVESVIVNGKMVIDQGRHTGALPGRALNHGRESA